MAVDAWDELEKRTRTGNILRHSRSSARSLSRVPWRQVHSSLANSPLNQDAWDNLKNGPEQETCLRHSRSSARSLSRGGAGALKFGQFTLKSGRISPYFFNADFSAPRLFSLPSHHHTHPHRLRIHTRLPTTFDVLFGPAYKGIPLAAATSLTLLQHTSPHPLQRKESKSMAKAASWGLVGREEAVREALDAVKLAGGVVVGVVVALDREEVAPGGTGSTMKDVEAEIKKRAGEWRLVNLRRWASQRFGSSEDEGSGFVVEDQGRTEDVQKMKAYRDQYGVKE
ncbi:hypothetical protein RhiXN_08661 [Rhizoctonia solani]|uniref:Orotate phosphoribosyltransferase n=1 Tax=Rhizoctonia solani TaxID=456999 RepID=A0A8H8P381_9AGAM|nr:uncharacterized protein RhiXN_08661 [Rhizoctonia solani]QRW23625.1 hypothetical protein RhiXN_08661 [Rhizoctonia solani]